VNARHYGHRVAVAATVSWGIVGMGPAMERSSERWGARSARADSTRSSAEASLDYDSNVQLQSHSGAPTVDAWVLRTKFEYSNQWRHGGHRVGLDGDARLRLVAAELPDEQQLRSGVDARWLYSAQQGTSAGGLRVSVTDTAGIAGTVAARSYRLASGMALLLLEQQDHRFLLNAGVRVFSYRPDPQSDHRTAVLSATYNVGLWQNASDSAFFQLSAAVGLESRRVNSLALVSLCAVNRPVPSCVVSSGQPRQDRLLRGRLELNYQETIIVTAAYGVLLIDSNSFGQSLVQHQLQVAMTAPISDRLFASALVRGIIDNYRSLPIRLESTESSNLNDESRSHLQVRLGYQLSSHWTAEAQVSGWRSLVAVEAQQYSRYQIGTALLWQ
jgi:hypothetical protein